jgi:hypothetical protein
MSHKKQQQAGQGCAVAHGVGGGEPRTGVHMRLQQLLFMSMTVSVAGR